jgi:hypothetical protein
VEPDEYIHNATSSDIVGAVNGVGSACASTSSKKCTPDKSARCCALVSTTMTKRKCGSRSRLDSTAGASAAATTIAAARLSASR